jgi:predicted transcriptional regulator of viral defense system
MIQKEKTENASTRAKQIIQDRGGIIRTSEALQASIHPSTLYHLRDTGELEQLSRGVYRIAEHGPVSDLDLVIVATRIPQAVICLVSALAFHEITTQVPHSLSIALSKGAEYPRLDHPPITTHRFSGAALTEGIEEHLIDTVSVKVYNPEKTLADAFKFRNKIGMDVVLEALRLYKSRKKFDSEVLLRYAKVCRVEKVMRPYLEASV